MSSQESRTHPTYEAHRASTADECNEHLASYHQERHASGKRALKILGACSVLFALKGGAWLAQDVSQGIAAGKEAVRESHVEVHEIYHYPERDNSEFSQHGTFVLTGLGTKDPSDTAQTLVQHRQVGDVFAVEYSNQDLNAEDIATQIIATAQANDILNISFDGYSAGGPISLAAAAYIHQTEPELHVASIVLNSSPIGPGSLTSRSQEGIDVMNTLLSLNEDFAYYGRGHELTEIIARSDRYLTHEPRQETRSSSLLIETIRGIDRRVDVAQLHEEAREVHRKLSDPKSASGALIKAQADFIIYTDYQENLRTLATQRPGDTASPVVFYTRALTPDGDSVVDVEASERNFIAAAEQAGLSHYAVSAAVGHANPAQKQQEYQALIREDIQPYAVENLRILAQGERNHAIQEKSPPASQ